MDNNQDINEVIQLVASKKYDYIQAGLKVERKIEVLHDLGKLTFAEMKNRKQKLGYFVTCMITGQGYILSD